jgi:hypothetical protein
VGSPVPPRCGRPVHQPLGGAHRAVGLAVAAMARSGAQQVRPLGPAAGDTQPAQRPHPPRLLAGGAREGQDDCLPRPLSLGRLSPPGVHDARRRRGRRQPLERLSRAQGGRQAGASNRDTLPQGEGIRAAPAAPRALARRCLLPQHLRDLLLLVQHPRRLQPLRRALGDPRDDEGSRGGDDPPARASSIPASIPGSSRTTARSSWPGTSRISSASAG